MDIKNEVKGNGNSNNFIQTNSGDINIREVVSRANEVIDIPTKKVVIKKMPLNNSSTIVVLALAFLADFTTAVLNFKQIAKGVGTVNIGIAFLVVLIAVILFFLLTIALELRRREFSSLLPWMQVASSYVFVLDEDQRPVLLKLKMTCPKCNRSMTIKYEWNGYSAVCKRDPDHNIRFDYTTLDGL